MPDAIGQTIVGVLREHAQILDAGAILTIDDRGARIRILPLRPDPS